MKKISVAHVIANIDSRMGGPAYAEEKLCRHLKNHEIDPHVFSFGCGYDDRSVFWDQVDVHHVGSNSFLAGWNPTAYWHFIQLISKTKIQLVHNQGLWLFSNYYARQAAERFNLPLMTSVRGMLEPWAVKKSIFKKKIALFLYETKNLNAVKVFHATSKQEMESIRSFGLRQPIAVIPNGVDLPLNLACDTDHFFPQLKNEKVLLFLSRIDAKKGVERLLEIWKRLGRKRMGWKLVIAGEGHANYIRKLKKQVLKQGLQSEVVWAGFVEGEKKQALWNLAQLFILPTFSENFGNVVAEAMSHGLPVITTDGTPWEELNQKGCGWWVKNDEVSIQTALTEALNKNAMSLKEMGKKGKEWVGTQYVWSESAKKMADTYRWILNQSEKPECVRLD